MVSTKTDLEEEKETLRIVELSEEMLERVKEIAQTILERVKKAEGIDAPREVTAEILHIV